MVGPYCVLGGREKSAQVDPSGQRRCERGSKSFTVIFERVSGHFKHRPLLAREAPKLRQFWRNLEHHLIDDEQCVIKGLQLPNQDCGVPG